MILRPMKKGRCNLRYCLGLDKKNDARDPQVLHGTPSDTQRLIDAAPFQHAFFSAALSYEPGETVPPENAERAF